MAWYNKIGDTDEITLTSAELSRLLDDAVEQSRKEACLAIGQEHDAVLCPWCNTTSHLVWVKDGRCPYCWRLYPVGTQTWGGRRL